MSTRVLLATLSIPITPERTDIARLLDMDGIIVEKQRRLATLLGLQAPPTRVGLINDMVGISGSILNGFEQKTLRSDFVNSWLNTGNSHSLPGDSDTWTSLRTSVLSQHCSVVRWFVSSRRAGIKLDVVDETGLALRNSTDHSEKNNDGQGGSWFISGLLEN